MVSHLEFIAILEEKDTFDYVINFLSNKFKFQILKFQEDRFRLLMKLCKDRGALIKFINEQITFDQFVARINCQTQGVSYKCRDDLLDDGLRKQFFDNLAETGKQLKAIHNVNKISQIKPEKLANNNSDAFVHVPEFSTLTKEKIRAMYQKEFDVNAWKSNKHCLKSIFSIIPEEIQNKVNRSKISNIQKFSETVRFKYHKRSKTAQRDR